MFRPTRCYPGRGKILHVGIEDCPLVLSTATACARLAFAQPSPYTIPSARFKPFRVSPTPPPPPSLVDLPHKRSLYSMSSCFLLNISMTAQAALPPSVSMPFGTALVEGPHARREKQRKSSTLLVQSPARRQTHFFCIVCCWP